MTLKNFTFSTILVLFVFSSFVHASEPTVDFKEYHLSNAPAPVLLSTQQVERFRAQMKLMAKEMSSCTPGAGQSSNPLIRWGKIVYEIKKSGVGCMITLDMYGKRRHSCALPKAAISRLVEGMEARFGGDELLGEFSEQEKNVLFKSPYCDHARL